MGRGPTEERLGRLVSNLNKRVLIPVYNPLMVWPDPRIKRLRETLLQAGAVDVVFGREYNQSDALHSMQYGYLTEAALNLDQYIGNGYFAVFCHECAEDIRHIISIIESFHNSGKKKGKESLNMTVEFLFIRHKKYRKDIVYLGPPNFQCISPRHGRCASDIEDQFLDRSLPYNSDNVHQKSPLSFWQELDEGLSLYFSKDFEETGLEDMSHQELYCTVYRLFTNDPFTRFKADNEVRYDDDSEGRLHLIHFKLMKIVKTHMKYLSELKEDTQGLVNYLLICARSCYEELDQLQMIFDSIDLSDYGRHIWGELGVSNLLSIPVQQKLAITICDLIHRERTGEMIRKSQIRNMIRLLADLSLYEPFEYHFLVESRKYYSDLASCNIKTGNFADYFRKVQTCLEKEVQRAKEYLIEVSEDKIASVVVDEMLANHMASLGPEFVCTLNSFVDDGSYKEIGTMVKLMKKDPDAYEHFCTALISHMKKSLSTLVEDKHKEPIEYIQLILDERDKFDKIIFCSLDDDMNLVSALYVVFQNISELDFQLAEYVSLYIDHMLVKCLEGTYDQEVGAALDKAVLLVADFHDKSVFEVYYQRHLADRLLSGRYSEEAEMEMVSRLRLQCSRSYVSKVSVMIKDMSISQQLMSDFNEKNVADPDQVPIHVHVLTPHSWPRPPVTVCRIPDEIADRWQSFFKYYCSVYNDNALDCCLTWGNTFISAKFGTPHEYELNVQLYHTCVLVLIDSAPDGMTTEELRQGTCIPYKHLKKTLFSLTCVPGKNILRKEPVGLQINKKDRFCINESFSSQLDSLVFETVVPLRDAKIALEEDSRCN